MNKDTVKDLTLMLMYLTSWEERLIPGIRKKPDRAGIYPKARICWKGPGTAEAVWNYPGAAWRRGG